MRYIIDKRTRHGQSRPSRAAREELRFDVSLLVGLRINLPACEARRAIAPISDRGFRLENGKVDVKFPRHRPPSVRHLVAASSERLKRAGPSRGTIGRSSRTPLLV